MAITVSLPISEPLSPAATLQSGGNLEPNTTYYFVVLAYYDKYQSPGTTSRFGYHSPVSIEGSFTTTETELSAQIEWTNPAEHTSNTRYEILLTKTSGDYTRSGNQAGTSPESLGDYFTTGESGGYLITQEQVDNNVRHSVQLNFPMSGDTTQTGGVLKVSVESGYYNYSSSYQYGYFLQKVYEAVVDAGYADHVFWDGVDFVLRGWLVFEGSEIVQTDTRGKNLTFIKGGIHVSNPNALVRFGTRYDTTEAGANPFTTGTIAIQHSRYPIRATIPDTLFVYGYKIQGASSLRNDIPNVDPGNLYEAYYIHGAQNSLGYYIEGYFDCMLELGLRNVYSEVKDLKCYINNNWSRYDFHRCTILGGNRACSYSAHARVYDTIFTMLMYSSNSIRHYVPASGATYSTHYYNPRFIKMADNLPTEWRYSTQYGNVTSDSWTDYNFSLKIKVIDESGNPIEGATVNITDKNGVPIEWEEHEDDLDRKITGNVYTTDRTTNSDGMVDTYYIKSYKVNLAPDNTIASSTCNNFVKTDYYPFTITVSKAGKETVVIPNFTLTEESGIIVKLNNAKINTDQEQL